MGWWKCHQSKFQLPIRLKEVLKLHTFYLSRCFFFFLLFNFIVCRKRCEKKNKTVRLSYLNIGILSVVWVLVTIYSNTFIGSELEFQSDNLILPKSLLCVLLLHKKNKPNKPNFFFKKRGKLNYKWNSKTSVQTLEIYLYKFFTIW